MIMDNFLYCLNERSRPATKHGFAKLTILSVGKMKIVVGSKMRPGPHIRHAKQTSSAFINRFVMNRN